MEIEIKGLDNIQKELEQFQRQMPYVMTLTINDLLYDIKNAEDGMIRGGLNSRKNTAKAFAYDKANKSTLAGKVRLKDDWHEGALQHHFKGGTADNIGFEKEMIQRHNMNGSNSAVPIKKIGKKKYRTIRDGTKRGVKSKYFVVPVNNRDARSRRLDAGVYTRLKRKVKPVLLFTDEATYRKRFDHVKIAIKVIDRRLTSYFFKNLSRAISTAR